VNQLASDSAVVATQPLRGLRMEMAGV
jgi:hypothetical protein